MTAENIYRGGKMERYPSTNDFGKKAADRRKIQFAMFSFLVRLPK